MIKFSNKIFVYDLSKTRCSETQILIYYYVHSSRSEWAVVLAGVVFTLGGRVSHLSSPASDEPVLVEGGSSLNRGCG